LSFGKLRMSYGITGSDGTPDYGFMDLWTSTTAYQGSTSLRPTVLSNSNYAWEQTRKLEVGLSLGFLKDRILLSANWYRNRSGNQLVGLPLAPSTGFSSVQANQNALVQNTGLELEINTLNIRSRNFSWTTALNLTIPRNKLVAFPNLAGSNAYSNSLIVGQPLTIQRTYHSAGVNPLAGVYQFQSAGTNGGNTYTPSYPADLLSFKNLSQAYYGGVQNTLRYKDWSVDLFIQFVDQTAVNAAFGGVFGPVGELGNQPLQVLGRWQKPGDQTTFQKFTTGGGATPSAASAFYTVQQFGDNRFTNASYARLKNLSISYQFPVRWMNAVKLQQARVYIQGQNLLTKTSYKGLDPESQSNQSVPPLKIIAAGIQVNL
jgi:hypothetical protein